MGWCSLGRKKYFNTLIHHNSFFKVHHTCLDSKELVKEIANTIRQRFYKKSGKYL